MTELNANFKQDYQLPLIIILLELWAYRNCEKPTDKDGNPIIKGKKKSTFQFDEKKESGLR